MAVGGEDQYIIKLLLDVFGGYVSTIIIIIITEASEYWIVIASVTGESTPSGNWSRDTTTSE